MINNLFYTFKPVLLGLVVVFSSCNSNSNDTTPNTLIKSEVKEGWKLLFDGETSNGWRGANKEEFPTQGWSLDSGMLTVLPGGNGGDIVTLERFSNFELSIDFKSPENSNSGIKYFVLEDVYEEGSALGLEYQTHNSGGGPLNDNGLHSVGCLYDLLPAQNQKMKSTGEWNNVKIISNGRHVEHWLNGIKVLEYERGGERFKQAVAKSKFAKYPDFGESEDGHILLQDHNDLTSFRNIKIRQLRK